MSNDDKPKYHQTPFKPKMGGFVGNESNDQIAISARKNQEEHLRGCAEFGRQIMADRAKNEADQKQRQADKDAERAAKEADRKQKDSTRARAVFLNSLPGLKSLIAGAGCVVAKWPNGVPGDYPAEVGLLIADLEQLISSIRNRQL